MHRLLLTAIVLIPLTAVDSVASDFPVDCLTAELLRRAEGWMVAGAYDSAAVLYEAALECEPGNAEALVGRGSVSLAWLNPSRAADWFDRALRSADDEVPHVMLSIGASYAAHQDYPQASGWFSRAMSELPSTDQASYLAFDALATPDELSAYDDLPPQEQEAAIAAFWRRMDPTPATELNERLVEHVYRVWYARRRYPNMQRWLDARATALIRYGAPDEVAVRSAFSARGSLAGNEEWTYRMASGSDLALTFRERLDMGAWVSATTVVEPTSDVREELDPSERLICSRRGGLRDFVWSPGGEPLNVMFSAMQFRADDGRTRIDACFGTRSSDLVFTERSEGGYEAHVDVGFAVFDSAWNVAARNIEPVAIRRATAPGNDDSIHVSARAITVDAGTSIIPCIQVRDRRSGRMQACRIPVTARDLRSDTLGLSDIVVAAWVRPALAASNPALTHGDIEVLPVPASRFQRGRPLHVYVETYGLTRGSEYGDTFYEIEHSLRRIPAGGEKTGAIRSFLRRLFLRERDEVSVGEVRRGISSEDHQTYMLDTGELSEGRYMLTYTVRDLHSGATVSRSRAIGIWEQADD